MPESNVLDFDTTVKVVEDIVKSVADDFVYNDECSYAVPRGGDYEPGCLVGRALFVMGWSVDELHELDVASTRDGDTRITTLIDSGFVEADLATRKFLGAVQDVQDNRRTWRDALSIGKTAADVQRRRDA